MRQLVVLAITALALSGIASTQGQHGNGSRPVKLPAQINGSGQIRVQAMVNERGPVVLLLDSGSCHSLLNIKLAQTLLLKTRKFDSKLLPCGPFASAAGASLTINGQQIPDHEFVLGAMENLFPGQAVDYAGTLGYDLFERYVVTIDYDRNLITLYYPRKYSYSGTGKRLNITVENLLPVLNVYLRRSDNQLIKGRFVLDTGAQCTVCLTKRFSKENRLMDEYNLFAAVTEIYVDDIKVTSGDIPTTADRQLAGTEFDGIVGAGFLRNYKVIMDYPHNQIILEPGNKG